MTSTENGILDAADLLRVRQHAVGKAPPLAAGALLRCNLIGPPDGGVSDCDVADAAILDRYVGGAFVTIANVCDAYGAP